MKKILILIIPIIIFVQYAKAQQINQKQGCDFSKDLVFKKGVDTIIVLGYKTQSIRNGPPLASLIKLNKEDKIKGYKARYGIVFKPLNCPNEVIVDCCTDTSAFAFDSKGENYHKIVQLRCIVFEGYFEFSKPYFIVDKIMPYE